MTIVQDPVKVSAMFYQFLCMCICDLSHIFKPETRLQYTITMLCT